MADAIKGYMMNREYTVPMTKEEIEQAIKEGKKVEMNGTAVNGGYGETWNTAKDTTYPPEIYRIYND